MKATKHTVVLIALVLAGGACGADPPHADGLANVGMAVIPAGEFWRGCAPDHDLPADRDCAGELFPATPLRQVTLSAFWIDIDEVSFGKFAACVEAGACPPPVHPSWREWPANNPAEYVTWDHADAYCRWMNKRLPTEAEWEKAARGADGRRYPWGDTDPTCDHAVFNVTNQEFAVGDCPATPGPQPVGSHPQGASVYGVNDMAGNVSEWVADWYAPGYDDADNHDPRGPASGQYKVVRGGNYGSWVVSSTGYSLRTSIRKALLPVSPRTFATGFRCVKSG